MQIYLFDRMVEEDNEIQEKQKQKRSGQDRNLWHMALVEGKES
jgi:hypothetical protein